MGAIGNCCCCNHPDCVGVFTLPEGLKAFTFANASNHPISVAGSSTFAKSSDSPCCVAGSLAINSVWDSGFVTGQIAVEDFWHLKQYTCCGDTPPACLVGDYDFTYHGGVAIKLRHKIKFCSLDLQFCAAKTTSYGVDVCGILVTATLTLKHVSNAIQNVIHQIKKTGTFYNGFPCTFGCGSLTPVAINSITDCTNDNSITNQLSTFDDVPPAIPADFSLADPSCSATPLCQIQRQLFLPDIRELPASFAMTSASNVSSTSCDAIAIFDLCEPADAIADTVFSTNGCGKSIYVSNRGEFCGLYICGTGGASSGDASSRSRSHTNTQSHPDGTALFNPFVDTWSIGIA